MYNNVSGHNLAGWGYFQLLMSFIQRLATGSHPKRRAKAIVVTNWLHVLTNSSLPP